MYFPHILVVVPVYRDLCVSGRVFDNGSAVFLLVLSLEYRSANFSILEKDIYSWNYWSWWNFVYFYYGRWWIKLSVDILKSAIFMPTPEEKSTWFVLESDRDNQLKRFISFSVWNMKTIFFSQSYIFNKKVCGNLLRTTGEKYSLIFHMRCKCR